MRTIRYTYIIALVLGASLISCGGSDGGGEEVQNPEKSILTFPNNNEECTAGVVTSNSSAKLTFEWEKAAHATSYTLFVKDLLADSTDEYAASTNTLEVTLDRGTPYSWYVVSKSNKTSATATSDTWKFYLAGIGVENYAPFPADLKSPSNGASITGTTVTIEWEGGDVDNDIQEYEVYLDTSASPSTKLSTTTDKKLENQSVSAGTTYYWKVVTIDGYGNTSTSQVYSFTTD
ncbi:hypothetical protein MHTCC0001_02000 [Flavobacteriaceae bacterium MHTCC 0001]